MNRSLQLCASVVAFLAILGTDRIAHGRYAAEVVSYDAGATPAIDYFGSGLPFDVQTAALGEPERFTGEGSFPGVVSPFNPPFLRDEIISVGEGGQITLRLSRFALPQADGPEIGVFTNAGLIDFDYPDGLAGSPAASFTFGVDDADVWVSEDGLDWVSLGSRTFDIPTNGYSDLTSAGSTTPGGVLADFQQPFTGTLGDFDGLAYYDGGGSGILDELAGSGGGEWLDISGTGLARVGYIRFAVADDLSPGTNLNFELDAVSVSRAAMGRATVPEPGCLALAGVCCAMRLLTRRRQRRPERGQ